MRTEVKQAWKGVGHTIVQWRWHIAPGRAKYAPTSHRVERGCLELIRVNGKLGHQVDVACCGDAPKRSRSFSRVSGSSTT